MPSRAMRFDGLPTSSSPPKAIEPLRLATMPMIARKVVVLPAPLRPSRVTSSPSAIANSMPCRMCDSPYQAWRSRTRSSAPAVSCCGVRSAASAMTRSHIGLDDVGVLRHLGIIALGQDLAAGQHGDGVGELRHHREIVLDHEDGAIRRDLADERRDARDILVP